MFGSRVSSGVFDWAARRLVWQTLLPLQFSQDDVLALYAHYLPFAQGHGLRHGAQFYYSKSPAELTQREVLELLAISRAPRRYSPSQNPERLLEAVEGMLERLEAPAT